MPLVQLHSLHPHGYLLRCELVRAWPCTVGGSHESLDGAPSAPYPPHGRVANAERGRGHLDSPLGEGVSSSAITEIQGDRDVDARREVS